jgi:hypothetical protein
MGGFFEAKKNLPNDPATNPYGLERPPMAKIEFVYADPTSPAYLGVVKTVAQLKAFNPIAIDVMQSPLVTATRYLAIAQKQKDDLQRFADAMVSQEKVRGAARTTDLDYTTPILAYFALHRTPEALAPMIGANAMATVDPLQGFGALGGYLAWGAMGAPAKDKAKLDDVRQRHESDVRAALESEMRRRKAALLAKGIPGWCAVAGLNPLTVMGPYCLVDKTNEFAQGPFRL